MEDTLNDEFDEPKSSRKKSRKSKKNSSSGIVFAIWFLIFLVLLVLFIVYSPKVMKNLKGSDFFKDHKKPAAEKVQEAAESETQKSDSTTLASENKKEPEAESKPQKTEQIFSLIESAVSEKDNSTPAKTDVKEESVTAANSSTKKQQEEALVKKAESEKKAETAKPEPKAEPKKEEEKPKTPAAPQTREMTLCFLNIKSDGTIRRKEVKRTVKKTASPLTDSINALLKGPTAEEENAGCTSLVSKGTKLLGAKVSGGVATLNFSEELENNNSLGVESLRAQIQQIVYTATVYSTVSSVQILIGGEKKSYFQCDAEEQFYVGSPLSRNSF